MTSESDCSNARIAEPSASAIHRWFSKPDELSAASRLVLGIGGIVLLAVIVCSLIPLGLNIMPQSLMRTFWLVLIQTHIGVAVMAALSLVAQVTALRAGKLLGKFAIAVSIYLCICISTTAIDLGMRSSPYYWTQNWDALLVVGGMAILPIILIALALLHVILLVLRLRSGSVLSSGSQLASLVAIPLGVPAVLIMLSSMVGAQPNWYYVRELSFIGGSFLGGAWLVSIALHMWSGWTLTLTENHDRESTRLSIRDILELTLIVAIVCAILKAIGAFRITVFGMPIFGTIGAISTAFTSTCVRVHLARDGKNRWSRLLLVFLGVALISAIPISLTYLGPFRGNQSAFAWLICLSFALTASCLGMGTLSLGLWWLKHCGWQLETYLSAKKTNRAEVIESPDPFA